LRKAADHGRDVGNVTLLSPESAQPDSKWNENGAEKGGKSHKPDLLPCRLDGLSECTIASKRVTNRDDRTDNEKRTCDGDCVYGGVDHDPKDGGNKMPHH
jgi:hypothetical protein